MTDSAAARTSLVVKATGDPDVEAERVNQALTVAATAAASGVSVSVWLTGEATRLARPDETLPTLAEAAPFAELVGTVLGLGTLTVCGQCAARRGLTQEDLLPGTRIAGAATLVEEVMAPGAQALVY